jgi:hypothetical protein
MCHADVGIVTAHVSDTYIAQEKIASFTRVMTDNKT